LQAPAQEIAAEAAIRRLCRADADDAARLAVAERAEAERARRIEVAPRLHRIAAEMRPLEVAAGDAIAHGKIRAAAADGESRHECGSKLIVEAAGETAGIMREASAADAGFAVELPRAVETGEPGAPARLGWCRRPHLLEGRMVRHLRLLGRGILQRLAAKGEAVDVDGFAVPPERALIHHDRVEHARDAERGFLRSAHPFAGEHVERRRDLARRQTEQAGERAGAAVEGV